MHISRWWMRCAPVGSQGPKSTRKVGDSDEDIQSWKRVYNNAITVQCRLRDDGLGGVDDSYVALQTRPMQATK